MTADILAAIDGAFQDWEGAMRWKADPPRVICDRGRPLSCIIRWREWQDREFGKALLIVRDFRSPAAEEG